MFLQFSQKNVYEIFHGEFVQSALTTIDTQIRQTLGKPPLNATLNIIGGGGVKPGKRMPTNMVLQTICWFMVMGVITTVIMMLRRAERLKKEAEDLKFKELEDNGIDSVDDHGDIEKVDLFNDNPQEKLIPSLTKL